VTGVSAQNGDLSDEQLVQRSLGDPDAFFYLMKRYEGKLLRYIERISNVTRDEAEDLLQTIFLKAYRNLNAFDRELKFSNWIFRIAHNTVLNHIRKKKVRSAVWVHWDDSDTPPSSRGDFNEDATPETDMAARESREGLAMALSDLPAKYREVLVLRYFEGKSYEEIGDILMKPGGTVATMINRAKKRLKKIAPLYGLGEADGI